MNKLLTSAVTVVELCPELSKFDLQLSDKQELLLTAIASYIHYECDAPVGTAGIMHCVVRVLNCINYDSDSENLDSIFDSLFEFLREPGIIHSALVYYDIFARLTVQEKLNLRDSCLSLFSKFCNHICL